MAFLFENVFMTMLGGIFIFFLWYMLLMIIPQTLSYKYIAAYMFCVCGYFLSFLTFISVNFFVPYVFIKENLSQDNLIEETLTSIILNIYYFFTSPIYFKKWIKGNSNALTTLNIDYYTEIIEY